MHQALTFRGHYDDFFFYRSIIRVGTAKLSPKHIFSTQYNACIYILCTFFSF